MAASAPAGERVLLDAEALQRTLHRIAHEIIEGNERLDQVALIGIHTRGVFLAQRLRRLIEEFTGADLALGTVDITFYRDDVQVRGRDAPLHPQPLVRATRCSVRSRASASRITRSSADAWAGWRKRNSFPASQDRVKGLGSRGV